MSLELVRLVADLSSSSCVLKKQFSLSIDYDIIIDIAEFFGDQRFLIKIISKKISPYEVLTNENFQANPIFERIKSDN